MYYVQSSVQLRLPSTQQPPYISYVDYQQFSHIVVFLHSIECGSMVVCYIPHEGPRRHELLAF